MDIRRSIVPALAAALPLRASSPFDKLLANQTSPVLLADLLYRGSGIGLWVLRLLRDSGFAAMIVPAR